MVRVDRQPGGSLPSQYSCSIRAQITSDGKSSSVATGCIASKRSVYTTDYLALRVFPCARLWANEPAFLYL